MPDEVLTPVVEIEAPVEKAPKKTKATNDAFLAGELARLQDGGKEGDYTLIPQSLVANNHTVEGTGVAADGAELCRKKA